MDPRSLPSMVLTPVDVFFRDWCLRTSMLFLLHPWRWSAVHTQQYFFEYGLVIFGATSGRDGTYYTLRHITWRNVEKHHKVMAAGAAEYE